MPTINKLRMSRRRLQGRKILALLPHYSLHGNGIVSVTAARAYVAKHKIKAPAVINVTRTEYTVDQFFWSERGMFGFVYVEFNWTSFPSLRELSKKLDPKEMDTASPVGSSMYDDEIYRPEFSFI